MKNKYLVLLFLLSAHIGKAQNEKIATALREFNNDTAQYVRAKIIAHKEFYIGKPFDSLLNDLPAVLQYVDGDVHNNKLIRPYSTFYFASGITVLDKIDKKQFAQLIIVRWKDPLDSKEITESGLGGGAWSEKARQYYGSKIIGDIAY